MLCRVVVCICLRPVCPMNVDSVSGLSILHCSFGLFIIFTTKGLNGNVT
jgi:hypothetical protein